jgi:hypothetical protein
MRGVPVRLGAGFLDLCLCVATCGVELLLRMRSQIVERLTQLANLCFRRAFQVFGMLQRRGAQLRELRFRLGAQLRNLRFSLDPNLGGGSVPRRGTPQSPVLRRDARHFRGDGAHVRVQVTP